MLIRGYVPGDCAGMAQLFYDTVHTVNTAHYTREQVDVWATGKVDLDAWNASFLAHHTLVAEVDGVLAGFADMDETGYLDRLYVHRDYQGRGIATALCDALEGSSAASRFSTHASITARPFFERRGYRVVKEQTVYRQGVGMKNFVMEKRIMAHPCVAAD